jgi:hypothetical protein
MHDLKWIYDLRMTPPTWRNIPSIANVSGNKLFVVHFATISLNLINQRMTMNHELIGSSYGLI